MPKSTFFTGQPVMNQLLSLVPRSMVMELARKHQSDHYYKKFKAYDHLVSMLFSGFHHCSSLRELITGLQANAHRLHHLGVVHTPRRSTLADANKNRSAVFFEDLFMRLYHLHYGFYPDSFQATKLEDKLFIIDSTTITLFSDVFKGAGVYGFNGRKKGGIKAHVLYRAKDRVPCFVDLTASSKSDRDFMPLVSLPKGSVIVMDKAYVNYKVMKSWTENHITWVSRLVSSLVYNVSEEKEISSYQYGKGVRKDQIIVLGNPKTRKRNPLQKARLVTYHDKESKREFQFLSNNLEYSPLTVAGIYERRWDIEGLFKRIKQNFQLYSFLGDNENAIKIQVWCTLIADLLVQVIKDKVEKISKRIWAFSNVAGLIRQHLTTYIDVVKFLCNPELALIGYKDHQITHHQLVLFKT
jgi:hypothetical protein